MDKYVKLQNVLETLRKANIGGYITDRLLEMPAADVQPVRHGHWYDNTYRYVDELDAYFIQACCSCCKRYSHKIDNYTGIMSNNYCSYCGADMRSPDATKG